MLKSPTRWVLDEHLVGLAMLWIPDWKSCGKMSKSFEALGDFFFTILVVSHDLKTHNVYFLILFLFSLYVCGAPVTFRASSFSSRELATLVDRS
ncbi:hypothetical protein SADUNF_Sadunf16G0205800 [Salix dunnii]|uniref:Uncharacterized protein n=1 Tax=Salix dunnii TaxID=1413687 RepID=A0A835JB12_9ROSI|nr:hypothetical protein SADUNF_Sadunf16G0205800 [Salix dunnii]